jgi:hypothetical protein
MCLFSLFLVSPQRKLHMNPHISQFRQSFSFFSSGRLRLILRSVKVQFNHLMYACNCTSKHLRDQQIYFVRQKVRCVNLQLLTHLALGWKGEIIAVAAKFELKSESTFLTTNMKTSSASVNLKIYLPRVCKCPFV